MKSFKEKVIDVVRQIPKGKVATYKEVARQAGNANASRAVGMIMSHNDDKNIPCHRVVRSDGVIGGYNGLRTGTNGPESKKLLLEKEGIKISKNGKILI